MLLHQVVDDVGRGHDLGDGLIAVGSWHSLPKELILNRINIPAIPRQFRHLTLFWSYFNLSEQLRVFVLIVIIGEGEDGGTESSRERSCVNGAVDLEQGREVLWDDNDLSVVLCEQIKVEIVGLLLVIDLYALLEHEDGEAEVFLEERVLHRLGIEREEDDFKFCEEEFPLDHLSPPDVDCFHFES